MPQDEMFQNIMNQAQQYGGEVRAGMAPTPVAPVVSQDTSQYENILNTISGGKTNSSMLSGMAQQAGNDYEWQERGKQQAAAAARKKYEEEQAKKTDVKRIPKADGGFDFVDGAGNPISAYDFALAKGTDVANVLSDSMNPDDMRLIEDYNGLKQFWSAAQKLEDMGKVDVDKFKVKGDVLEDEKGDVVGEDDPRFTYYAYISQNPEMKNMSLDETRKLFMKKWSRAYFADPNYKPSY
jgi:hypothetical protein